VEGTWTKLDISQTLTKITPIKSKMDLELTIGEIIPELWMKSKQIQKSGLPI